MNFRPELAQAVCEGRKTVTRRLPVPDKPLSPWSDEGCRLRVGGTYAVCPGRGQVAICRVTVTDVRKEPLHLVMMEGEAEREGFDTLDDFIEAWKAINGAWTPMSHVWRVAFELAS